MKKFNTFKLIYWLVILCIITSVFVGSTLAKYVTQGADSDAARVAGWGVKITKDGSLYSKAHSNSVESAGNVVAPGTDSGEGFEFAVSGVPEVDVKVFGTIKAQDIYLAEGSYAIMSKINIKSAEEFDAYISVDTSVEPNEVMSELYTRSGDLYVNATKFDEPTYLPDPEDPEGPGIPQYKQYYLISDDVTVTETYYPLRYSVAGTAINATGTANEIARVLMKLFDEEASVAGDYDSAANITTYSVGESEADLISANTDLSIAVGLHRVTWSWELDGNNNKDSILGRMMSGNTDSRTAVKKSGSSYKKVEIDKNKKQVTVSGRVVAMLGTNFDIDITVAQQN